MHSCMTVANILTLSRILIVIPFTATFYVQASWAGWAGVILYWSACITDYFDGAIARKRNQTSNLGKFLDPIADKLLIATALIMLAGTNKLSGLSLIPAIVILGRELFVSGLREYLSADNISVPVSFLAKWKTACQMVSLSFLVVQGPLGFIEWVQGIGILMLWLSAGLALITGYQYWTKGVHHLT